MKNMALTIRLAALLAVSLLSPAAAGNSKSGKSVPSIDLNVPALGAGLGSPSATVGTPQAVPAVPSVAGIPGLSPAQALRADFELPSKVAAAAAFSSKPETPAVGGKLGGQLEQVAEQVGQAQQGLKAGDVGAAQGSTRKIFEGAALGPTLSGESGGAAAFVPLELSPQFRSLPVAQFAELTRADTLEDYSPATRIHLQSHKAQLQELFDAGLISREAFDLGIGFAVTHDRPYVYSGKADIESREKELKFAWGQIALSIGKSPKEAALLADETYAFVRRAFDVDALKAEFVKAGLPEGLAFAYKGMVGTVLGHGSMGVVETMRTLDKAGWSKEAALGWGLLTAAHHPGFPITLVHGLTKGLTGKVPGLAVPDRLLPLLMVREGVENGDLTLDSESLRGKVADYAAGKLGISRAESRMLAVFGYALDRITAARRNYPDAANFRLVNGVPAFADWNTPGKPVGEVVKKYSLIYTNIMGAADIKTLADAQKFTLEAAFAAVISSIEKETLAAAEAAEHAMRALSGEMDAKQNAMFRDLRRMIIQRSLYEVAQTKSAQDQALRYGRNAIAGFSGQAYDLDQDIERVSRHAAALKPGPERESASFLLSALVALRTGPAHKAQVDAVMKLRPGQKT